MELELALKHPRPPFEGQGEVKKEVEKSRLHSRARIRLILNEGLLIELTNDVRMGRERIVKLLRGNVYTKKKHVNECK